jgi:LuxR family maltose regulon positive regulatory protein
MSNVLLRTKLSIPPERTQLVSRPRLIDQLLNGLTRRLTLISAPAGSGKSTLVSAFVRGLKLPVAWLSLDPGDDDRIRFLTYLIAALQSVDARIGESANSLIQSPQAPPIEQVMTMMSNDLAATNAEFVLVLDDYHVIKNEAVHQASSLLLDHLPPGIHLLIVSRTNPPLPLARWRARDELTEVRMGDLRFTPDEAARFLNEAMRLKLPTETINALTTRTEGWITGLQLAALSLQQRADSGDFIKDFSGRHHHVLDYLVDEVIGRQSAGIQTFLLKTSILERLSAALCEAVTELPAAQSILSELERTNLFLIPLDEERQWYRYHHLFSEFLLARAQSAFAGGEIAALHQRAASWLARHDFVTEAIDHAFAAGDFDFAAQLIEQTADELYARGAIPTLRAQLERLPENVLNSRPRASIYYAWTIFFKGLGSKESSDVFQQAEVYLRQAEQSLDDEGREELGMIYAVRTSMAGAARAQRSSLSTAPDLSSTIQCGERALQLLPERNLTWRSVVNIGLGFAYRVAGDIAAATRAFSEAGRLSEAGGNLSGALYAHNNCGALLILQGQLYEAERVYRDALRMARDRKGELLPITGQIYIGLGRLLYEWNRLDEAARCLDEGRKRAETGVHLADIFMTLARVHYAARDVEAMRRAIDAAARSSAMQGISAAFMAQAELEGARLKLAQGDVAAAVRWAKGANLDPAQPTPWRENEYLTLARVLIAQGIAERALPLLESLHRAASGRAGSLIEILVLQAIALRASEKLDEALSCLKKSLALAEPADYVRVFVDEGEPLAALLHQVYQGSKKQRRWQADFSRAYVERLLLELRSGKNDQDNSAEAIRANDRLVEPLRERELEILRLIAAGHSNQEIAAKLFVAPSTIKWHVKNLYGKLNVGNRAQAIARAQQQKLL